MGVRLKLYENIHIAFRAKVLPQHGAEQGEFPDVVPQAELLNDILWNFDVALAHISTTTIHDFLVVLCIPDTVTLNLCYCRSLCYLCVSSEAGG